MKKLKLDLDNVKVDSFPTSSEGERKETVKAYQETVSCVTIPNTDLGWNCNSAAPGSCFGSCIDTKCVLTCNPPSEA